MCSQGTKYIQSIERASAILDYIATTHSGAALGEISEAVGLGKSTAHGLIATLLKLGYLQQNPATQYYSLGIKFLEMGQAYLSRLDLKNVATPYLWQLKEEFQETVHLGILSNDSVVYVEKVDSNRSLHLNTYIGLIAPAYCTGIGKGLLMALSDEELDELYEGREFTKYTSTTLDSLPALKDDLAQARERGYAFDMEEIATGLRCVSAPILGYRRKVVASISIAGPIVRMEPEQMHTIGRRLKEISGIISALYGVKSTD